MQSNKRQQLQQTAVVTTEWTSEGVRTAGNWASWGWHAATHCDTGTLLLNGSHMELVLYARFVCGLLLAKRSSALRTSPPVSVRRCCEVLPTQARSLLLERPIASHSSFRLSLAFLCQLARLGDQNGTNSINDAKRWLSLIRASILY